MNIGAIIHGQWRNIEGGTEVKKYRSTEVQMYRRTERRCYREDGGSWFNKKGPIPVQLRIVRKTVGQMQGWGNGGE